MAAPQPATWGGYATSASTGGECHLRADPQQWLKDLAKRWARWQLSTGLGAGTVADGTGALARFGVFLAYPTVAVDCVAKVDRPLLERYLPDRHAELAGRVCHGSTSAL